MLIRQTEAANRCILILSFCVLRPNIAKPGSTLQTSTSPASSKSGHSSAEQDYPTTGGDTSSLAFYCCLPARFCPEGIGREPARFPALRLLRPTDCFRAAVRERNHNIP